MSKVVHITTIDISLRFLLLNQLRSIQQAGFEVTGISAPGEHVTAIERAGIRHIAVSMSRRFTPLADLVALWRLFRVMRRERFSIVHTHTPKPGLLGQLAARMAGVPVVINTLHGFYFHDRMRPLARRFYILTEKIAARCSDVILSQNSEDVQTAVREKICPPEKIKFLGNGIDIRRFDREKLDGATIDNLRREIGIPHGRLIIGFVGRLVAEKGVLEFLRAAQLVRERSPHIHLLFVGPIDREKADALSPAVAGDYGLQDICTFTGLRVDMPELYALMDVFVLPSHREGFPRSPMEASAMRVPCVVTDIRGCREAVAHEENGLLVPPGDNQKLADAITLLLADDEKRRQMGERGRQIAVARFDEQLVFDKVKAEYHRLLVEKNLPAPEKQSLPLVTTL